jgi:heme A synthase
MSRRRSLFGSTVVAALLVLVLGATTLTTLAGAIGATTPAMDVWAPPVEFGMRQDSIADEWYAFDSESRHGP